VRVIGIMEVMKYNREDNREYINDDIYDKINKKEYYENHQHQE
jgi:hypothetical protein